MKNEKRVKYCQLPTPGNIAGRSSSITNAFFNSIIPIHAPSEKEELEALRILEMNPEDIRCVYCGDRATEWDHLRPIIRCKKPTGFITEIANLVPACGKCNQSKGGFDWETWILGPAARSPKSRGIPDLERRVMLLKSYEAWRQPIQVKFEEILEPALWKRHNENWTEVLTLLDKSQALAREIRKLVENATARSN